MRKLSNLKHSKLTEKSSKSKNHYPVLILGAGFSGLSGAVEFLRNGFEDFLVIEGDSSIGGRVKNFDFNGTAIELGANWLSDISAQNPIWNLAQEVKLGILLFLAIWIDCKVAITLA
jgi:monoamine oxidase